MEWFYWLEIIFVVCSFFLVIYYLFFWRKLARYKSENHSFSNFPFVSIVICAKNEEQNLSRFIPQILDQEYPSFEVIVVNDNSSDGSMTVLNNLKVEYDNLRVYSFSQNKKCHASSIDSLIRGLWPPISGSPCSFWRPALMPWMAIWLENGM